MNHGPLCCLVAAVLSGWGGAGLAADYRSVADSAAVLYDAPSAKSKKLYVVSQGYPVEIVVVVEGWSKVRLAINMFCVRDAIQAILSGSIEPRYFIDPGLLSGAMRGDIVERLAANDAGQPLMPLRPSRPRLRDDPSRAAAFRRSKALNRQ